MLPAAPVPFSWGDYVAHLTRERGGLTELTRHLLDVAPPSAGLSDDPGTVERGLRRLRARGTTPADKYGRLLLRCLGLPPSIEEQARALGQYHSRFSDLSTRARGAQLRAWDVAPIAESACAAWIHLGLASLAFHGADLPLAERRLALAALGARAAGPEAELERWLFEARLRSDRGDAAGADTALATAAALVTELPPGDGAACYVARLHDQRAYRAARGWRDDPARLVAACGLYAAIPEVGPPFARFRRAHGLAWCTWRLGDAAGAAVTAAEAARHAGDGGFVRFRAYAVGLHADIVESVGGDAAPLRARAREMAVHLGE